jgi:hypothetical protein
MAHQSDANRFQTMINMHSTADFAVQSDGGGHIDPFRMPGIVATPCVLSDEVLVCIISPDTDDMIEQ